jgi:AcrR family transcriptional regulator
LEEIVLETQITDAERPAYHHGDLRRALIDAAIALVEEQQSWGFSLRELARRAGVSHNAPYSHFAGKAELLAELAVSGFELMRDAMARAAAAAPTPDAACAAIGEAYIRFGRAHPGRYRLMFRSTLMAPEAGPAEPVARAAHEAKMVIHNVIRDCAVSGVFAVDPQDPSGIELAVLACWSSVHGLTMLFLDNLLGELARSHPERVISSVVRAEVEGLRRR